MSVVLLLAALAILGGVVVVAVGRGGELTIFRPDSLPFPREFATAADVASFRPPPALLGYSATATDDALRRIVRVVAERDAELARLRAEIAVLRGTTGLPGQPAPGAPEHQGEADWIEQGTPAADDQGTAEGWPAPDGPDGPGGPGGPSGIDAWRPGAGGWGIAHEDGEATDWSPARDWSQTGETDPSADWGGPDERTAEKAWGGPGERAAETAAAETALDDSAGWAESGGSGEYGQSELGWAEAGGHDEYGPGEAGWAEAGGDAESGQHGGYGPGEPGCGGDGEAGEGDLGGWGEPGSRAEESGWAEAGDRGPAAAGSGEMEHTGHLDEPGAEPGAPDEPGPADDGSGRP